MNLVRLVSATVAARANWGRWIADCLTCGSADRFRPGTPDMTCMECGAYQEIVWPAESLVVGVERLLMMRPNPATRNWEPGETLHDLLAENVEHGVITGDGGQSMMIIGDQIRTDTLPTGVLRQAIGA